MPKASAAATLVGHRDEVVAQIRLVVELLQQPRPGRGALTMASWVVKLLEATMNSVVSGYSPSRVLRMWFSSTLET
jgi:hypothetical protein